MTTTCQEYSDSIPKELKPFIRVVKEPCVFKEIPDFVKTEPTENITKAQAHADIEMLQYLFDYAYSGRYYWEQNGFDFKTYYKKLHSYVDDSPTETVDVRSLENAIFNNLYPINDGHTAVVGFSFQGCYRYVKPFYAEIIIEKQDDKLIVIESNQPGIEPGMEYNDSTSFLFKTLPKQGTEQFLLGTLSMEKVETLSLQFNNHNKTIQLHPSRLSNVEVDRENIIVEIDTIHSIPIVRSSTFNWGKENVKYLDKFVNYGKELKDKPFFIWNLTGNRGGDASFPNRFIRNFNDICQHQSYGLVLHSPAVNQCYWKGKNDWLLWPDFYKKALNDDSFPLDSIPEGKREKIRLIREDKKRMIDKPIKYWEIRMKPDKKYGNYNGKAIILINNQTGSISKPVAALRVHQLAEDGTINLDSNVNNYLSSWKLPDNEFTKTEKVTTRRILNHTAGLTVWGFPGYDKGDTIPGVVDVLNGKGNTDSVRVYKVPGESWMYSGGGYTIMQLMITDIEQKSFPEIMKENILNPLGMKSSTFENPLPVKYHDLAATGYRANGAEVEGK